MHDAARRLQCGAVLLAALTASIGGRVGAQGSPRYVGSPACQPCHEEEYRSFQTNARKAKSFESVQVRRKGLTDEEYRQCLQCHTTGYGRPGGFRSEAETPDLKEAGCEVCHGPGSVHVETLDRSDIKGKLTARDCEACHNRERVAAFRHKALVFGGAH